MKEKLILNEGDELVRKSHETKGPWDETDIYEYSVVDVSGAEIGTVKHTDHTSQRGSRTQHLEQREKSGKVLVDISW